MNDDVDGFFALSSADVRRGVSADGEHGPQKRDEDAAPFVVLPLRGSEERARYLMISVLEVMDEGMVGLHVRTGLWYTATFWVAVARSLEVR